MAVLPYQKWRPAVQKKEHTALQDRAKHLLPVLTLWGVIITVFSLLITIFILSARKSVVRSAKILFPCYIDPGPDGTNWARLVDAVQSYPNVSFVIVINPNNGPNTSVTPDPNYIAGLRLLKASSPQNIQMLGYVHQSYGKRALSDVDKDIRTWATWSNQDMYNTTLDGIFFDEGPYENSLSAINYVQSVNNVVRSTPGFARVEFTVQNPGTLQPQPYFKGQRKTDTTIILENTYEAYLQTKSNYDGLAKRYGVLTTRFSMILSAVPKMNQTEWNQVVSEVLDDVAYMYLTDAIVDQYAKFGDEWESFVKAVASVDRAAAAEITGVGGTSD